MQEFNIEIRDKKGVENVVADHLSRLSTEREAKDPLPINEHFPDEQLFQITTHTNPSAPWYAILPTIWLLVEYLHISLALIRKSSLGMYDIFLMKTPICLSIAPIKLFVDVSPTMR